MGVPRDRVQYVFDELATAISERVRYDRLTLVLQGLAGTSVRRLEAGSGSGAPAETVLVPLFSGAKVVGRIHIRRGPDPFTSKDRENLSFISRLVAAAVVGMTETAQSQQRLGEAELLLEIGRATAMLLDPKAVALRASAVIERIVTRSNQYGIYVYDEGRRDLVHLASFHHDPHATALAQKRFSFDEVTGAKRVALTEGRVVYVPVVEEEEGLSPEHKAISLSASVRARLVIPIRAGGEILGFLQVAHPRPYECLSLADRRLLEGIADQVALSLRNAQLASENARRLADMSALSRRLWSVQEEERRRIARELHDEAGQAMTALKLNLDLARKESDPTKIRPRVVDAAELASDVLEELRRIARDLRPPALDDLGLIPALRGLVDDFGHRSLLDSYFEHSGPTPEPDRDASAAVYRFVQESLSNVSRHAKASWVRVSLETRQGEIRVRVEDDGVGFDTEATNQPGRLGLLGLRERARVLGGRVTFESGRGRGARVDLEIPAEKHDGRSEA